MKKKLFLIAGMILTLAMASGCDKEDDGFYPASDSGKQQQDVTEGTQGGFSTQQTETQTEEQVDTQADGQSNTQITGQAGTQTAAGEISEEEAKQIAFADAGVQESEITGIRVRKEIDDFAEEYEVEFYVGSKEYDYEIDAATGKILAMDTEIEDDFAAQKTGEDLISEDDAVAIVLEKLPEAEKNDVRIRLEREDGRMIYEGSVYLSGSRKEYEFEIDAATGTFLSWEED